ncbi:FecR domain-containing protein [Desulfobulbus sp. F4]|nr:FecR domain-containing protein [Desulfobulbus sp. F4]
MTFRAALIVLITLLFVPSIGQTEDVRISEQELLEFLNTETTSAAVPSLSSAARPVADTQHERGAEVGRVQTVQGAVLIIHEGGADRIRLNKSLPVPVFSGDTLVTEKASRVTVLMRDGSLLALAAQSKLLLDKAVYNQEAGVRDTRLKLLLGKLRAVVSRVTGKNLFIIQTPTAAAGVRGTDFALAVGPSPHPPFPLLTALVTGGGQSSVLLTDSAGRTVQVGPLSATVTAAQHPPSLPSRLGQAARNVLRTVGPELERAAAESAAAVWEKAFRQSEAQCGLERAVKKTLATSAAPAEILALCAAKGERTKIRRCIKALCCAGADKDTVQSAAALFGAAETEMRNVCPARCGSARR